MAFNVGCLQESSTGQIEFALEMEDNAMDMDAVCDHFNRDKARGLVAVKQFVNHKWEGKKSFVRTMWETNACNWVPAKIAKKDQPMLLADCVFQHQVVWTRSGHWNTWARKAKKSINGTAQCLR